MQYQWLDNYDVFGLSLFNIALALAAAVASYVLMRLALRFVAGRMRQLADRTSNRADDLLVQVLSGTSTWLLWVVALLIGVGLLDLSPPWSDRVSHLWFVALAVQAGVWCTRGIRVGVQRYEERHRSANGGQLTAAATLLSWSLRTVLWAVVLLAVLSNLGVNITAFVASLGVGGIAIALAVQNILGDLFASLSIAVDKPFEVGDFIGSSAGVGTVVFVGLKTTRIRTLSGEELVIGNTDLLKQPLKNYRRMLERRIAFKFRVAYGTPVDKLQAIPDLVRAAVEADPLLRFDRAHLMEFGESSLDFEVVYIVKSPDYNRYMDAQQALNLALLREFAERGIEFAFPTRTVVMAPPAREQAEEPRLRRA